MEKPDEVISEAKDKMLALVTSVADPEDFDKMVKLRDKYPDFVFLTAGFHPERMEKYTDGQMDDYINKIKEIKEKIIGVGEIGLDYNWIKDEINQKRSVGIFEKFIDLAIDLRKPIVIHARNGKRNAITEVLDILEK